MAETKSKRGGRREGAGRPKGSTAEVARSHRIDVRLYEDEFAWLSSRGEPREVIRDLIADARQRELGSRR